MKLKFLVFAAGILFIAGCSSVPITGRKQLNLVSDQEVLSLSLQQYGEYMQTAPQSTDAQAKAMVARVGQNIANAVKVYYQAVGAESMLNGYSWEFSLIRDGQVNAFCMPGGKIVVYEGILPYTQDEAGLAVVLGHEVAHAIAKHSNERMSHQIAAGYGAVALDALLSKSSGQARQIGQTVFGLGAEFGVMLPYSRKQEFEADLLGLIFMSIAGYNPNAAVSFWQRMSQQGSAAPEFMSTHPSDGNRIAEIQRHLPEAMEYYNAIYGGTTPNIKPAGSGTGGGSSQPSNSNTSNQWTF